MINLGWLQSVAREVSPPPSSGGRTTLEGKCAISEASEDEFALIEDLVPLTIRHLILDVGNSAAHEKFVERCFGTSQIHKFPIKYNIYPKSLLVSDIIFVSGSDIARMISFLTINERLIRNTPRIALVESFGPQARADLLNAGYDDVINLEDGVPREVTARALSIRGRWRTALKVQGLIKDARGTLSDYCDQDKLSIAQKKLLNALIEAPNMFCSYQQLAFVLSKYRNTISKVHIRVLVWQIRLHLNPAYTIKTVQGEGYRLVEIRSAGNRQRCRVDV